MNKKIIAGGAAVLLSVGLGVAAVGSTSAYFSDTNSGGYVAASLGSIKVSVDDDADTTPVIDFGSMLPGEVRQGGFTVQNIGRSAQDLYITYPNDAQLKIINQLGTYAEIEITVDGERVFFSDNLNDGYPGNPDVTPLPAELLLAEGLAPGSDLDVQFSLTLADKWTNTFNLNWPTVTMQLDYDVVATQPGITPGA